jgi:hypothetical protein
MSDLTLVTLFDQVREKTLRVIDGVSDEESLWTPAGLDNSIRWHAGHCYVVVEWLCAQALGADPTALPGWFETFGWDSNPRQIRRDDWPQLAILVQQLNVQHLRLRTQFAQLHESQLDAVLPQSRHLTVRGKIVHAIHDEACHCGEMWLLRKMIAS